MYDETLGQIRFWLTAIAFNITFLPMHFLGLAGMPRRIPDYALQFAEFNMISSIGGFMLGASQLLFPAPSSVRARRKARRRQALGRRRYALNGRCLHRRRITRSLFHRKSDRRRGSAMQAHVSSSGNPEVHYVPPPSVWPLVGSTALPHAGDGFVLVLNKVGRRRLYHRGGCWNLAGHALRLVWQCRPREPFQIGYASQVDRSFRWGWSGSSSREVMFFAGFFGALFYARNLVVPMLADAELLWPDSAPAGRRTAPVSIPC